MMRKACIALLATVSLTACDDSDAVKFHRFATACLQASFTPQQCQFLWNVAMSNEKNADNSDAAMLAVGIATGTMLSSGARR